MNQQDLKQKIRIYHLVGNTSPVHIEENLSREIIVTSTTELRGIISNEAQGVVPIQENFNANNQVIKSITTTRKVLSLENQIKYEWNRIFIRLNNDENWYRIISKTPNMNIPEEDNQTQQMFVYVIENIQLEDRKNNFIQRVTVVDVGDLETITDARISKITVPQMIFNKVYGIDENNSKIAMDIDHLYPMIVSPVSARHDSKYWHLHRDRSKALNIDDVSGLFQPQKVSVSTLLPNMALQQLYIDAIAMTYASSTGFREYNDNEKVAGITVSKITKLSPDICVKMVIDNYLNTQVVAKQTEEWRKFMTAVFASSRFIAGGKLSTEDGQDETAAALLPFYIENNTQIAKTITKENFYIQVYSKLYKITDRTTGAFEIDETIKTNLFKEQPVWVNEWYQYSVMTNKISIDTTINNISQRMFEPSSSIKKHLCFGQFTDLDAYKKYLGQDAQKPSVEQTETKTFAFAFDYYETSRNVPNGVPSYPVVGIQWFDYEHKELPKAQFPDVYTYFLEKAKTKLPKGWTATGDIVINSVTMADTSRAGVQVKAEVVIKASTKISVTSVEEVYNNPLLDAEDTRKILNIANNSKEIEITPENDAKIQYVVMRAPYFDTYKVEVELTISDPANPNPTKKTIVLNTRNFPSKLDNTTAIEKVAISQSSVI